jgi:hypothetical protein
MSEKSHRALPEIPKNPQERQRQIEALLAHPLWEHPRYIPVPPDGVELCEPIAGSEAYSFPDTANWPIKNVPDGSWHERVSISVVYVNPTTEKIEDDETRNTAFRVWLEAGGWADRSLDPEHSCGGNIPKEGWNDDNKWIGCHDYRLNCGAPTLDEALLELARLVNFFYCTDGTERENVPESCDGWFEGEDYHHGHTDDGTGYCVKCGFRIEE